MISLRAKLARDAGGVEGDGVAGVCKRATLRSGPVL